MKSNSKENHYSYVCRSWVFEIMGVRYSGFGIVLADKA